MAYDRKLDVLRLITKPTGDDEILAIDRTGSDGEQVHIPLRALGASTEVTPTGSSVSRALGDQVAAAKRDAKFILPAGAKVAVLGSSSVQNNHVVSGGVLSARARGPMNWARARLPSIRWDNWLDSNDARGHSGGNFGFSSTTVGIQRPYVSQIVAGGYDACVFYQGMNDLSGTTPKAIRNGIRDGILEAMDGGVAPILSTLQPRATTSIALDSLEWRRRLELNDLLRDLAASSPDIELIELDPFLSDMTAMRQALAGVLADGLHLSSLGGWLASQAYYNTFSRLIDTNTAYLDLDPTYNNLFGNGLLTGTGGSASNNVTGTLPDQVRFGKTVLNSSSCVASVVPDTAQGSALRLVFTIADVTAAEWRMQFATVPGTSNSGIPVDGSLAGQWVRAAMKVYVRDGSEFLAGSAFWLQSRTSSTGAATNSVEFGASGGLGVIGDTTQEGKTLNYITDAMPVPVGTTHIGMSWRPLIGGAASGTLDIELSHPKLWVVDDPRI